MSVKPIGNRVLLKEIKKENNVGGIIIPDNSATQPVSFEVVELGEGGYNANGDLIPIKNILIGDVVVIGKHSGYEIKDSDETFRIVNANEILAVIK